MSLMDDSSNWLIYVVSVKPKKWGTERPMDTLAVERRLCDWVHVLKPNCYSVIALDSCCPLPRPTALNLNFKREAQKCPYKHNARKNGQTVQRWLNSYGIDYVRCNQELETQEDGFSQI